MLYDFSNSRIIRSNFCKREIIEKITDENKKKIIRRKPEIIEKQRYRIFDIYDRIPGMPISKISKLLNIGAKTIFDILEEKRIDERNQGFTRDSYGKKVYFKDMNYHHITHQR